jgi:predicted alpha/beta hydrolase family esterase
MKIVLLSGQSYSNKEWIERVQEKFLEKYTDVEIMYYEHWDRQEGKADVELETERFLKLTNNLTNNYILFAKSIGTVIFLNSLEKLEKQPQKVVMVGVPNDIAKEKGYDFKQLKISIKCDVDIYQKESDPMASYGSIKGIEGRSVKVNKYECIGEENNTHDYENLAYLLDLVS